MSLAIDRRRAAYEFLPQLLAALPSAVPSMLAMKVVQEMPNTAAGITPSPRTGGSTTNNTNNNTTTNTPIDCNYLFAAARLVAFYASSSSSSLGGPSPINEYNVTLPHLMTRPDGYLSLIACLYRQVPGTNILAIETLKKLAVDCLTTLVAATDHHHRMSPISAIETVVHYLLREQSNDPTATTTTTSTSASMSEKQQELPPFQKDNADMISNILKSMQDDVALLRRISRIHTAQHHNNNVVDTISIHNFFYP